ncbi:MAG: alpha/beta fold hydrolase [Rhodobacter sp.]|nr:alpha/beta fold hydrolase [Paracoccaceae bacterium]MCC0077653.1 alpha/beta fold hydrolase [Rhodobacter sp.]
MRASVLALLLLIAACAVREQADFVQAPTPGAVWQPVLVATTRGPDPDQPIPGWDRSYTLTFGRYVVSIPPDREPGRIPRPRGRMAAEPEHDFMLAEAQPLTDAQFESAVRSALSEQSPSQREAVIFVHGFNTAFVEGVYRAAQLKYDLGLPGAMLHYSWPSLGAPLAYVHDRDSALFARDGLVQMLHRVRDAGAPRIILVAHSMGSQLVMEALRTMSQTGDPAITAIGGVVLISPDIDVDLFRQQVADIRQLPTPFLIMTSQRDRVLQLSARLSGETTRLGNLADAEPVAGLGVTLIDVSAFSEGAGHFTAASSPSLLHLFDQLGAVHAALDEGSDGSLPLLPATILTLQNTTQVILQPMTETRPRQILPTWLPLR